MKSTFNRTIGIGMFNNVNPMPHTQCNFVKTLHLFFSLQVWASKWNERAFISCRKANLNHDNLCMAVLIQETICGDYAFVIHTKNPLSGDNSEIYTEVNLPILF